MSRLAAVLLLLLASPAFAAGPPNNQPCAAAPQFVMAPRPLDALKAAIDAHRPVRILAVGSGATTGAAGVQAGSAFPDRMRDALRAALPLVEVRLTVRGGRGMTAEEMLPLVEAEVKQAPPVVVLWQTGTVEAVRGLRVDRMRRALRAGLDAVRAAGGSLVLIDPQFTRALRANTDLEPYEAELQQIATLPSASLFRRYELTRGWALEGRFDPERAAKDAREEVLARLNACLGETLARYLLNGAGIAAP
jgi:hypothetical protein